MYTNRVTQNFLNILIWILCTMNIISYTGWVRISLNILILIWILCKMNTLGCIIVSLKIIKKNSFVRARRKLKIFAPTWTLPSNRCPYHFSSTWIVKECFVRKFCLIRIRTDDLWKSDQWTDDWTTLLYQIEAIYKIFDFNLWTRYDKTIDDFFSHCCRANF